jgi:hypothetical protein
MQNVDKTDWITVRNVEFRLNGPDKARFVFVEDENLEPKHIFLEKMSKIDLFPVDAHNCKI